MGREAKLNKSAVLKKAIESVTHLRQANARLTQQNLVLKMALTEIGKNPDKVGIIHCSLSTLMILVLRRLITRFVNK